jgi:hypothetical protein
VLLGLPRDAPLRNLHERGRPGAERRHVVTAPELSEPSPQQQEHGHQAVGDRVLRGGLGGDEQPDLGRR